MICLTYRDLIVIGLIYVASGAVSGFIRGFMRGAGRSSRRGRYVSTGEEWEKGVDAVRQRIDILSRERHP